MPATFHGTLPSAASPGDGTKIFIQHSCSQTYSLEGNANHTNPRKASPEEYVLPCPALPYPALPCPADRGLRSSSTFPLVLCHHPTQQPLRYVCHLIDWGRHELSITQSMHGRIRLQAHQEQAIQNKIQGFESPAQISLPSLTVSCL